MVISGSFKNCNEILRYNEKNKEVEENEEEK
jgi:hypothetical protein